MSYDIMCFATCRARLQNAAELHPLRYKFLNFRGQQRCSETRETESPLLSKIRCGQAPKISGAWRTPVLAHTRTRTLSQQLSLSAEPDTAITSDIRLPERHGCKTLCSTPDLRTPLPVFDL